MAEVTTHERTGKSTVGGSILEMLAGVGAVVLAIIGLADVSRFGMTGAATIVVGAALMLEGGALLATLRGLRHGPRGAKAQLGGPASIAILGGIAGIVLGAFALAGIASEPFLAIAAIVYGGTLILASMGTARAHAAAGEGGQTASGLELLAGVVAVTLGILALFDIAPMVLTLIALLAVGSTVLVSGTALSAHGGRVVLHEEHPREPPPRYVGPEHRHA
ncbi:MAG TPA: hypothetical protein VIL20_03635 [Sandaracinaceae bacterium]